MTEQVAVSVWADTRERLRALKRETGISQIRMIDALSRLAPVELRALMAKRLIIAGDYTVSFSGEFLPSEEFRRAMLGAETPQPVVDATEELPMLSCIMATADRRRFVSQSLAMWQAQDYPTALRELVIVDDGRDRIGDLVQSAPGVRYISLRGEGATPGEKWNIGIDAAKGHLIAIWDDDDWFSPWRLTFQARSLLASGVDIVGSDWCYFCETGTGQRWLYQYIPGKRTQPAAFLCGTTHLYRRRYWEERPYPDSARRANDWLFIRGRLGERALNLSRYDYVVARHHGANNNPRDFTASRQWAPAPDWPAWAEGACS